MSTWVDARRSGRRDVVPVGECLAPLARRLGAPEPIAASAVFGRWEELVGADVASHAKPWSLRGGVLTVVCNDTAWAAQLRFLAGDLLTRIRTAKGTEDVREVRVKVASLAKG